MKRVKIPSPWEAPLLPESSARKKGNFRVSEESTAARSCQAEDRNQHKGSWPPPCFPQPETSIFWCTQGMGTETLDSEIRSRERTQVACTETDRRSWSDVQGATRVVYKKEPRSTIEASLLTSALKGGVGHAIAALFLGCL